MFGSGALRDDEFTIAIREITEEAARAVAPMIDVDIPEEHRRTLAHALVELARAGANARPVPLLEFRPGERPHDLQSSLSR